MTWSKCVYGKNQDGGGAKYELQIQNIWLLGYFKGITYSSITFQVLLYLSCKQNYQKKNSFRFEKYDSSEF